MDTQTIISRYEAGESAASISQDSPWCHQTIINKLRKAGVEVRNMGGSITETKAAEIAAEYASSHLTFEELGAKHNIAHGSVAAICKRYGVKSRSLSDYPTTRVHQYNLDYFKTWSPNMAYILGMVATDGSLQLPYTLRIYQKETDLLDQIQHEVGSDLRYDICGKDIPTLRYCSKEMVQDLIGLGIHPNKCRTIRAPPNMPPELAPDYIRGVFDGDGHGTQYRKRKAFVLRMGFTSSSKEFLEDIQRLCPVPIGGPYQSREGWNLLTSSLKNSLDLREWIYSGKSTLFSKRKKDRLYIEKNITPV